VVLESRFFGFYLTLISCLSIPPTAGEKETGGEVLKALLLCGEGFTPSLSLAIGGANFPLVDDGDPSGITSTKSIRDEKTR
jgi:hypothetical protein